MKVSTPAYTLSYMLYALRSWLLFGIFYASHVFVRMTPPLVALSMMKEYSLTTSWIGVLSGLFFLTYTSSQLLAGLLFHRYPTKWIMGMACLGCALTSVLLSLSFNFITTALSFMGYAFFCSFSFLGTAHYISVTLPHYQSLLVGITQSLGMAAGFIAINTISQAILFYSWREIVFFFSIILGIWGVIILIAGPKFQKTHNKEKNKEHSFDFIKNLKNKDVLLNGAFAGFLHFPMMTMTEGGYGLSLLSTLHPISRAEATFALSMVYLSWIIGAPVCGYCCDRYNIGQMMLKMAIAEMCLLSLIIYIPMSLTPLSVCIFLFGLCTTGTLCALSRSMKIGAHEKSSMPIAITNIMMIMTGSLIGVFLPFVLDRAASNIVFLGGVPFYHLGDYKKIFGTAMLGTSIMAIFCAYQIILKERSKTLSKT